MRKYSLADGHANAAQSRTQSSACARARKAMPVRGLGSQCHPSPHTGIALGTPLKPGAHARCDFSRPIKIV
jgi:hypothetical protein